jgi:hypothetical protein
MNTYSNRSTRRSDATGQADSQRRDLPEPLQSVADEITHSANDFMERVGDLIRSGNLRKVSLKDRNGNTLVEVPFSTALIGATLAIVILPGRWLALASLASMFSRIYLTLEDASGATQDQEIIFTPENAPDESELEAERTTKRGSRRRS